MNPLGYRVFNIRNGHVASGDPAFDRQMDLKLHDWFQRQPSTATPHDGPPQPALVVAKIAADSLSPHAGDSITLQVTIINDGIGAADASHASVAVNDEYSGTEPVPALRPHQGVEVDFPNPDDPNDTNGNFVAPAPGSYWVNAVADSQHELPESNPNGNTRSEYLSVY